MEHFAHSKETENRIAETFQYEYLIIFLSNMSTLKQQSNK